MREKDFEYLYNLEERFWWFVAMRTITDTIVGGELEGRSLRILDAGCGTGYNIAHYQKAGHSVFALDIAPEAIAGVRQRGFRNVCQASVVEVPYISSTFDFVFSFDVLSQVPVQSGDEAIREMYRVLKPGGLLYARVPAFEWLRSSHDEDLHTMHRYACPELRSKLQEAGFDVRLATYANTFLFPVVLLRRFLKRLGIGQGSDVKPLPMALAWLDPVFRGILGAEARVLGSGGRLPFGLSVICYARKPSS
jgi:SAM-dependent methyltransferase